MGQMALAVRRIHGLVSTRSFLRRKTGGFWQYSRRVVSGPTRRVSRFCQFTVCEVLEIRQLLTANGLNVARGNQLVYNPGGALSSASMLSPEQAARSYLTTHFSDLGLTAADVSSMRVDRQNTDSTDGVTYLYFQQLYNGLDVSSAELSVTVRNGQVLTVGNRFIQDLSGKIDSATARYSAAGAVLTAGLSLGVSQQPLSIVSTASGVDQSQRFSGGVIAEDQIPVQLVYQPGDDGKVHLAWNMNLAMLQGDDWWNMAVDAASGTILSQINWTLYDDHDGGDATSGASTSTTSFSSGNSAGIVGNRGTYNVYPLPLENPNDGSRSLIVNPADPVSSPFGWHDTNGAEGAEYTDTRGNNVWAQEDTDNNNTGGFRPDGGATLNFDFPIDFGQAPSTYQPAAITQLFYMNNMMHDIFAHYGFTEAAGNFQQTNYTGTGFSNDAVRADAQDGSGNNNANFSTPPDGASPRMQQYKFTAPNPDRDSDLDNGVIAHEYGHGISNRLTGNGDGLYATQSRSMGEGWSDFFALMVMQQATDQKNDAVAMGKYVLGQDGAGIGIRRQPYSYDMTVDPITFSAYNTSNEVHNAGEIWASTLWDMNWLFIDRYGFSTDIANGTQGNNQSLQLVVDALKIQPTNPSFLDARDAILAADMIRFGGANQDIIWQAFARRGMGVGASTASAGATTVVQDFTLPGLAITSFGASATYTAKALPVVLSPTAKLSDSLASNDWQHGNVTVTLTGGQMGDVLGIRNGGKNSPEIWLSKNVVLCGGAQIGTFAGGTNGAPLVITFGASVNPSAIQKLLQNLTFSNSLTTPNGSTRTVSVTVNNGTTTSTAVNKSVTVLLANQNPTISKLGATASYTEGGALTFIADETIATVTDDSSNFDGGKLTVSVAPGGEPSDALDTRNILGVAWNYSTASVSFNAVKVGSFRYDRDTLESLIIDFNTSSNVAAAQAILKSIGLYTEGANPTAGTRKIEVVLTDGDGGISNTATRSIKVIPVNNAPLISTFGADLTYNNSGIPLFLSTTSAVDDLDSLDFLKGKLTISQTGATDAGDNLTLVASPAGPAQVGIAGKKVTFNGVAVGAIAGGGTSPLVITFTAAASKAAVDAILRRVAYSHSGPVTGATRTINVNLTDGDGGTAVVNRTVTFT